MFSKKVLCNAFSVASRNFGSQLLPIPERIEYNNGFLIDPRPGKREVIEEIKQSGTDKVIKLEIPDLEDRAIVGQYLTDLFNKTCSMFHSLDPKYEDTSPFFFEMSDHLLDQRCSILAFENDKLIGFVLNSVHYPDEFQTMYPRGLHHPDPKFEIKSDYGKDIDNGPYPTRKGNVLAAVVTELYTQTGKFLPKDVKNLGISEAVGMHPSFARSKVFWKMMEYTENIFRQKGCNYLAGYCVAEASYQYCNKRGYETLFCFPYDKVLDYGTKTFQNLHDGAYGMYFQLLKL